MFSVFKAVVCDGDDGIVVVVTGDMESLRDGESEEGGEGKRGMSGGTGIGFGGGLGRMRGRR